jgi:excisionase family DNA binding protein
MSTYLDKEIDYFSDWISQAEAARLRGSTRQAVAKLVKNGRLQTIKVGGHTLVSRNEVLRFKAQPVGRRRTKK